MSFFGNSRNDPKNPDDPGDERLPPRSERPDRPERGSTNLLDPSPDVGRPMPATPQPPFSTETRTSVQAGPTAPDKCTNVIAAGAKWKGSLTVDDSVRIEGNFSGEIQAKGTVHVSDGAQVDAKIHAAFVVVSGSFRGELFCEQRCDLLPRSRVSGEIIAKVLSVQDGAILDGRVDMTGSGERTTATRTPSPGSARSRANGVVSETEAERRAVHAVPDKEE
jgi:cytoskeletal protein CcmA (bactofilin family)